MDDPLARKASYNEGTGALESWGPPGSASGLRLNLHAVSTQYQSFVLHTHLAVDPFSSGGLMPAYFGSSQPQTVVPPLSSSLLVPLYVDGLWLNGWELPRENGACWHFPTYDATLTAQHGSVSVVTRLLLSEVSPTGNIKHASTRIPCGHTIPFGQYPYAVTWRVDNRTGPFGSGRLVVAHRNAGDSYNGTFYSAWLQGAGITPTPQSRTALENVIRQAVIKTSTLNSTDGEWRNTRSDWMHPRVDAPGMFPHANQCSSRALGLAWRFCPPSSQWNISAHLRGAGGEVTLEVHRRDHYGGNLNVLVNDASESSSNAPYILSGQQDARVQSTLLSPPITTNPVAQLVNGRKVVFPVKNDVDILAVSPQDYFQPHVAPTSQAAERRAEVKTGSTYARRRNRHSHPSPPPNERVAQL
jgi:hypothetical protein